MAGIPSTSKPLLNYTGPPCHGLCDCGCCGGNNTRNEGENCFSCFACTKCRCLIYAHLIDSPVPTPSPKSELEGQEIELASDRGSSSLSSVELESPQPICESKGCVDCNCCVLNICELCPECTCARDDIWPSLDEIDDMLEAPQSREDPEMVDLIEQECADDEDSAREAFLCLPDMMRDIRQLEDDDLGLILPQFAGEGSDMDDDMEIGKTFFHNEVENTITFCGNDPE